MPYQTIRDEASILSVLTVELDKIMFTFKCLRKSSLWLTNPLWCVGAPLCYWWDIWMSSLLLWFDQRLGWGGASEVHKDFLCFWCVELEVVVLAPGYFMNNLLTGMNPIIVVLSAYLRMVTEMVGWCGWCRGGGARVRGRNTGGHLHGS